MRSLRQNPVEPREASGRARSASLSPSGDEAAVHHSESNQATEDDESLASVDDYEEKNDNMSESEVDAKEATPILPTTPSSTPSQQASEPRAWSSVLTTVKNAVYTPFKFFGRTPTATETATTNVKEPEFTFSHPHKPAQPLTTPTRSSKQRAKPQSERRSTATNKRRVSNPARIPQTERQRRHVDRSTPLHLRGVSSTRDMQDLHAQQASTRQRQREKEMTSLEENELSHGKTFRAPSPSSESESDDDGDVTTTMADNDEDEPISPPRKTEWRFLPQTIQPARKVRFEAQSTSDARHEQKIWSPTKPLTLSASLKFPTPEEIAAASVPGKSSRLYWQRDEIEMANPAVRNACWKEPVPSKEDNCPFYYVKDQTRRMPYFRKLHKDDTEFKCYNMFGEEAYWFRFPLSGYFVELNHNQEPFLRGQHSMTRWRELMKNPEHLKKEKKALLWKWAQVPEWRKPLLLPEIRPFYKQLMEIGEFAPAGSSSTSAATSSGMNSTANPSGTYKFPEDDESDEEGDHVETDNADQAQFQTPPPKPRPGNAQLPQPQPQPTPARAALAAALANANKHRPSAPSNLRNVTQMSPLQQPDQENRENTIENGGNGTIAKETRPIMTPGKETTSKVPIKAPDAWLKEAEEANMTPEEQSRQLQQVMKDLMNIPDEDIPNIILPKAPKLQLPFGEDVDYVAMNAATKAAFEMNKENHGGL
ncbi:hypothetical protein N431DRAFT_352145 [Stipitochalara longipes BDJ]|nr:hypothetical protein N431DRAFT_352145 [Stipitochalara longipes BDJ]